MSAIVAFDGQDVAGARDRKMEPFFQSIPFRPRKTVFTCGASLTSKVVSVPD
jgi:hypothetical protein